MDDDLSIHRLEGSTDQVGGLVIKKKSNEKDGQKILFKVPDANPRASLLGLDTLAAEKKKEKRDRSDVSKSKVTSYKHDWDGNDDDSDEEEEEDYRKYDKYSTGTSKQRNYRAPRVETPSHPGGVSEEYKDKQHRKLKDKETRGVYASSKDSDRDSKYRNRDRRKDKGYRGRSERDYRDRDREKYYERNTERSDRSHRSVRSSRRDWDETPSRDEISTPRHRPRGSGTPSGSAWDEDDDASLRRSPSTWDMPSPSGSTREHDRSDRSQRSTRGYDRNRKGRVDDTPLPTPSHKYNQWAHNRKRSGATPRYSEGEKGAKVESEEERRAWEDEQKKLDRQWYGMDEGYDDQNNPFATMSDEYTKKKEEEFQKQVVKKISAQQRQINKDNDRWEMNRMLTSGVVLRVDEDEDMEEDNVARVHLLVHNIVPPFLDGRIVFTKQPEPVIPIKDGTSDMAIISRKGSIVVRQHREQKEKRKAQHKHWELAGTKLGDIMGKKKKVPTATLR